VSRVHSHCVILFKRLLGDPMVPRGSKFWLGGLILYLAMPIGSGA
jgi:hypothetical protein